MNFQDFIEDSDDLKDDAVVEKLKLALERYLELDIEIIRDDILTGSFDFILMHEQDDAFGTEGLSL